ncbi:T9SS type A sorting domain-containing protein, partial [Formosa sp. S-31]|uniref:T9SS type A sorting domain-containing protein n=1 Tax=Formosa sp. S-31 TaxID=2790949 RepID=UPI003EBAEA2F
VEADAGDDQTICAGESVTLTASGGSAYVWSNGETTASITVSPSETTTYTVTVSEGDVSATDDVTVNVTALPVADAGNNQTIEQGESVTLTATGGTSYKWNTGETTASITVTPNQTRTYTVEVFNDGGCSDSAQVKVTVNAVKVEITADAGADQTICAGESVTLTASGGSAYVWSNGETTESITVSPSETKTYVVTVSEGDVSATDAVAVNVTALPVADAGTNQTIEQGESVTLTATGGTSYKWNTGETTASITVSPNQTRTYTVEVFNDGGCSDTAQVRVTVNIPTVEVEADAGDDQTICAGESVTLTATGGSAYVWSNGETTESITVSPSETTTYTVTVSEGDVSATDAVTVNVTALPVADAGTNQTIEQGESVTLTATGGTSYKWNTGETTASITVTPNQTRTYTVEVFNDGGCSDSANVTVTVEVIDGGDEEGDDTEDGEASIVIADAGADQTICIGESVTLTASGGSAYVWSNGETTESITVSPSETTTYTVTVSEGDVSATDAVTVNVTALPVADAGNNQTIEQGESVTLTATGGTSYKWNTGETRASITVTPNQTRTYTVEVFNDGGCSDSANVTVTVEVIDGGDEEGDDTEDGEASIVIADAGADQTICVGESVTLTASGGSAYVWSNGETTESITVSPSETTTYTVTVSEGNVSATDDVIVSVAALPVASAGADQTIEQGESVTLTATGGTSYKWNKGETTQSITVSPDATTTYEVEVYNENGCWDLAIVMVIVEEYKDVNDDISDVVKVNFDIDMYPNPTTGILNLKIVGLDQTAPIRVYDMSGKLLLNEVVKSDGTEFVKVIDLSAYPKGFYLLTLQVKGKTITKKVVLN